MQAVRASDSKLHLILCALEIFNLTFTDLVIVYGPTHYVCYIYRPSDCCSASYIQCRILKIVFSVHCLVTHMKKHHLVL